VPPLLPVHCQRKCVELSAISFKVPAVHALFVLPHTPLTGVGAALVAVQVPLLLPPFWPRHVHVEEPPCGGLVGEAGLDVPAEQYAPEGKVSDAV
jgi:hypothetical protein